MDYTASSKITFFFFLSDDNMDQNGSNFENIIRTKLKTVET